MPILHAMSFTTLLLGAALAAAPALAQEPFDACQVLTREDAEKVLGVEAAAPAEAANPKVRRPRFVPACSYTASKDGKPLAASVQFRFGRSNGELKGTFDDARLQWQTKPLLIGGEDAFWSGKTGQIHVLKGRAWITLSAGPVKESERDIEVARKLAEIVAGKI